MSHKADRRRPKRDRRKSQRGQPLKPIPAPSLQVATASSVVGPWQQGVVHPYSRAVAIFALGAVVTSILQPYIEYYRNGWIPAALLFSLFFSLGIVIITADAFGTWRRLGFGLFPVAFVAAGLFYFVPAWPDKQAHVLPQLQVRNATSVRLTSNGVDYIPAGTISWNNKGGTPAYDTSVFWGYILNTENPRFMANEELTVGHPIYSGEGVEQGLSFGDVRISPEYKRDNQFDIAIYWKLTWHTKPGGGLTCTRSEWDGVEFADGTSGVLTPNQQATLEPMFKQWQQTALHRLPEKRSPCEM